MLYRQICSSSGREDEVKELLKPYFQYLADAYIEICKKQMENKKAFFGLRDFYRFVPSMFLCVLFFF